MSRLFLSLLAVLSFSSVGKAASISTYVQLSDLFDAVSEVSRTKVAIENVLLEIEKIEAQYKFAAKLHLENAEHEFNVRETEWKLNRAKATKDFLNEVLAIRESDVAIFSFPANGKPEDLKKLYIQRLNCKLNAFKKDLIRSDIDEVFHSYAYQLRDKLFQKKAITQISYLHSKSELEQDRREGIELRSAIVKLQSVIDNLHDIVSKF